MIFEAIRSLLFPFDKVNQLVPRSAHILDIGCGHGILARLLATKSQKRIILGIDPSSKKIKIATDNNSLPNLTFKKMYLKQLQSMDFDTICIVDVLYLLPTKKKIEVFKKASQLLKKNGQLLVCEVKKNNSLFFKIISLQEKIMIYLLGITHSDSKKLHFLSETDYRSLLEKSGFSVRSKNIDRFLAYPHFCLVALNHI